tara:strand:- start:144 stop:830 length:687 start_codon:yes stop_codon:yes gene_type:complete
MNMKKIISPTNILDLAKAVSGFTISGEGNVSVRDDDTFLIKASGTDLISLTYEDLVRCDLDGNALEGEEKKPSMEVSFHAWILKNFPDINCVCHTHPTHTNKILCSGRINDFANKRLFPDQVVRNGVKSCVVPYATPGIKLRNSIMESVENFIIANKYFPKLILLTNHGIITASSSINDCITSTLMCEKSAEIFIGAKLLNNISFLTQEQIDEIDNDPSEKYRRSLIK